MAACRHVNTINLTNRSPPHLADCKAEPSPTVPRRRLYTFRAKRCCLYQPHVRAPRRLKKRRHKWNTSNVSPNKRQFLDATRGVTGDTLAARSRTAHEIPLPQSTLRVGMCAYTHP